MSLQKSHQNPKSFFLLTNITRLPYSKNVIHPYTTQRPTPEKLPTHNTQHSHIIVFFEKNSLCEEKFFVKKISLISGLVVTSTKRVMNYHVKEKKMLRRRYGSCCVIIDSFYWLLLLQCMHSHLPTMRDSMIVFMYGD